MHKVFLLYYSYPVGKIFEIAGMNVMNNVTKNMTGANMEAEAESVVMEQCRELQDFTGGLDFSKALYLYWKASRTGDEFEKAENQEQVLRWFRGEYRTNQEAKKAVGINGTINDGNWFDYICLWSRFFVMAGYKGFIVMIDETINIYRMANVNARQNNYEKMLEMYNTTLQGKADHLGIIMSGTPASIYDAKRGVFSYEALHSRLSSGVYRGSALVNTMTPIIKVLPLTKEEMFVLLEKLSEIHADLYGYEQIMTKAEMEDFVKLAYMKRETISITPRTMIRDYLQILDVKRQNPDVNVRDILREYRFMLDEGENYQELAE